MSEATVVDTPEGIEFVRLCTLKGALRLELLGMKRRGRSVYSIVKQEFGFKGNKQKVYEQLENYIEDIKREHAKETELGSEGVVQAEV